MHVFEFRNRNPRDPKTEGLRIIIIGDNYRAYEQSDGSVLLNDENCGYSFYPDEPYEEFRKQFNLDWRKHLNTVASSVVLPATSTVLSNG